MLTKEQQEAVDARVSKTLRAWRKGVVVGFLILAAGLGFVVHEQSADSSKSNNALVKSGRVVSVAGCNRDFASQEGFRRLFTRLIDVQDRQLKRGLITPGQYQESVEFYTNERAKIQLPDCRDARSIITDNPDDLGPIPEPKHP